MFIRVSSQFLTFLGPINAVAHHGKGNVNSLRSKVHDQILTSQQLKTVGGFTHLPIYIHDTKGWLFRN